jgi:hypothetical protein
LTSLPALNPNLKYLICYTNRLGELPSLNENIEYLDCNNNRLWSLPYFNEKLQSLKYDGNPISEIIHDSDFHTVKLKIQKMNDFRHLYYCLKFKRVFQNLLWEKVREPAIMKRYHPIYLEQNVDEDTDLDVVLQNW